ncbi:hypothetical protein [Marinobacter sp. F3R11]|uniref:hypothetical protein n=1 Tax=Marinobacter sp. F3R11 TaxID=2267231 RepID=UPI000DE99CFC|nr:hypothetical protein [Marinobacter sp. F3R11]RBW49722.1 hypothetical protein DS878_05100 [Marinobacter sp. F3R11]
MFMQNQILNKGLLIAVVLLGTPITNAEVIFSESFDDQPDWNSGLPENDRGTFSMSGSSKGGWDVDVVQTAGVHTIPIDWDFVRQTPSYAPSLGDADRHETLEVSSVSTAENPNRARGQTGKSLVSWRDSDMSKGENSFQSDGILLKYYPEGFDQLYIEFWVNFSDTTVATYYNPDYKTATTGLSKLFRVYHWDGTGLTFDYYSNKNPNFLWGFEGRPASQSGYGFRNLLSALTRRTDSNDPSQSKFLDYKGNPSNDLPSSYHPSTLATYNGSALIDKRDGGMMAIDNGPIDIDQVFGDETKWTKMAFFVKMNSAPGAYDGTLIQWVDDTKVIEINTMQWVAATRDMVKWNAFGFGGNDNFNKYPDELRHEEWYAIDDIVVATEVPEYLTGDSKNTAPPSPPLAIGVE